MSRIDQAISILQQGRPALLIDDFCPGFLGFIVYSKVEDTKNIEAISNSVGELSPNSFYTPGGLISYCGINEAVKELSSTLGKKHLLLNPCYNTNKETASERELRNLSTLNNIPPIFLTDIAKLCFQKEIKLTISEQETINETKFIRYSNPYNDSIYSLIIKGQVDQIESHDFESINLFLYRETKPLQNLNDRILELNNHSRGIILHIFQPESEKNEINRTFMLPAKILSESQVKRVKIICQHKSSLQGIAAFGIEAL